MQRKVLVVGIIVLLMTIGFSGCFESGTNGDGNADGQDDEEVEDDSGENGGDTTDETEDNEENEVKDCTIPPSITSLIYDNDKFDVYNLVVETWGIKDSVEEKLGNGFVSLPGSYDSGRYYINGTFKNIAGYELERVDVKITFYDVNDEPLIGSGTTHYRIDGPMGSICAGCKIFFNTGINSATSQWGRYHHMTITITVIE